ncbi:MAG: hypothetical protein RIB59_00605 [Rhodospirillales bacterium]
MTDSEAAVFERFPGYRDVIVTLARRDARFRDRCGELRDTDKRLAELLGRPGRLMRLECEMLSRRQGALIEEIAVRLTQENAA